MFLTVQGEGSRAGELSVFVRFAGCNLWSGRPEDRAQGRGECARWCDTDFVGGEKLTAEQVVDRVNHLLSPRQYGHDAWIVLTGGEPSLQLDFDFVNAMHHAGIFIAVETNGTVANPALEIVDWVTLSPKLGGEVKIDRTSELKVVLPGSVDGYGWTDRQLEELGQRFDSELFVQPQDPVIPQFVEQSLLRRSAMNDRDAMARRYASGVQRCFEFVRTHPNWRIGVQGHKLLDLP